MSHHLSQPEEIDLALMELEENEIGMDLLVVNKKHLNGGTEENQYGGHIPLYRKALANGMN